MTKAGVFGLWAGPGVVTASVAGLLWLHGATGPGWHVRTWPADGSAPDGELEDRSRGGLTLESASDAPDR